MHRTSDQHCQITEDVMIGCQLTIVLVISEYDPYRHQGIVTVMDGTDIHDGKKEALMDGTGTGNVMVLCHGGTWTENAMKKSWFKYIWVTTSPYVIQW